MPFSPQRHRIWLILMVLAVVATFLGGFRHWVAALPEPAAEAGDKEVSSGLTGAETPALGEEMADPIVPHRATEHADPVPQSLPAFSHEFLQLGEVLDEELRFDANRIQRCRLATVRESPSRVFIEETYQRQPDGSWASTANRIQIAGEWMLKVAPGQDPIIAEMAASYGAKVIDHVAAIGLWTLRFEVDHVEAHESIADQLHAERTLEAVLPNAVIWPIGTPNDPGYETQWEFGWIDAERAWDIVGTAALNDRKNIILAVVDTGVNVQHADLKAWRNFDEIPGNNRDDDGNGQIDDINGFDFYTKTGDVQRTGGHGVGVSFNAGRISNNEFEKASTAGLVDIMACVCFSTSGAGSSSAANKSIIYAVDNGARVINCSFVGGSAYTYMYALNYAEEHGVIVVAGAGNNSKDIDAAPMYPVASTHSNVVGVGATESDDARAGYSNFGKTAVEIFAPAPNRGTSHATPVISAAVSLLIADDPEAPPGKIIERLLQGVDKKADLAGKAVSEGRLNLLRSLRLNSLRRPAALAAHRLTEGGVRLTWEDRSTAETGFIVERAATDPSTVADPDDANESMWEVISSSIPPNTTYFDDMSAGALGEVFYRVRAKGSAHDSARNFVTRVPVSNDAVPTVAALENPVQTLYSQGSEEAIELAWFDPGSNETGFVLERKELQGGNFYEIARLASGTFAFLDTDVNAGEAYSYRLKTFNRAHGIYSSVQMEKAEAEVEPIELWAPETLESAEIDHSSIMLVWSDRAHGETGYRVLRADPGTEDFAVVADLEADATFYQDSGLEALTTYLYRVETYSPFGVAVSATIEITTEALPAVLAEPILVAEAISSAAIHMSWLDDLSARHTGYRVERALGQGDFVEIANLSSLAREWIDTEFPPETNCRYRVGTEDGSAVVWSNVVTLNTPALAPLLVAPVLNAEILGTNSISLSWSDDSERETGYVIEFADSTDGPFLPLATLSAGATGFDHVGLTAGQRVAYRVRVTGNDFGSPVEALSELLVATTRSVQEQWRIGFFGAAFDDPLAAPSADPDGDGWSNMAEFATLQSPVVAQPSLALPGMTSDHRVSLHFDRRVPTEAGFRVEATRDLKTNWHTLAELPAGQRTWILHQAGVEVEELPGDDGGLSVTVIDGPSYAGSPRYLRLVITSAP